MKAERIVSSFTPALPGTCVPARASVRNRRCKYPSAFILHFPEITMSGNTGLLSPYRVLDLTQEDGWLCGKILGDLGADVIQIEPPGGNPARCKGPHYHDEQHPELS